MGTFKSLVCTFLLFTLFCAENTSAACNAPNILSISNVYLTTADVSWPGQAGATGYFVSYNTSLVPNTSATGYTTTLQYSLSGLTCGVKYYVFVRTYCGPGDTSSWVADSFTTTNCCYPPASVTINVNSPVQATAVIGPSPSTSSYEYYIGTNPTPSNGTNTSSTNILLPGLTPGTTYYFCIRAKCSSGEPLSQWICDTFQTPNCYPPDSIIIEHLTSYITRLSWTYSAGATGSEYYISLNPPPPTSGWQFTTSGTVSFSNLVPDTTYYVCVRHVCPPSGYTTPWTCDTIHTPPLNIGTANTGEGQFKIYPNPAQGQLTIETAIHSEGAQVEIVNTIGSTVLTQEVSQKQTVLNISNLPKGVYLLQYKDADTRKTIMFLKL